MSNHFIKVPHVDEERLDDALILLHPETLQLRFLNETAAVLWDALGEFPTAQALTGLLAEARPDISFADGLAYVTTFLDELADAGFVERQERPSG
jgi:Coenzyme PQQ synthesis protein D (PqqD)